MKVVGLFSGIGGFELGFDRAGHEIELLAESDPKCSALLGRRFPGTPRHGDVRTLKSLPRADLVLAGFPCQPFSQAGKTEGLDRARELFSHIFRLLDSAPPTFAAFENVPFIRHLEGGRALHYFLSALEQRGWLWAYREIDTQCFGLPQRRRRWLLLASRTEDVTVIFTPRQLLQHGQQPRSHGFYWTEGISGLGWADEAIPPIRVGSGLRIASPPAVWDRRRRSIGTITITQGERLQGFPEGWTDESKSAYDRWQMLGNAVSVPVSSWLEWRLRPNASMARFEVKKGLAGFPTEAYYDGDRRCQVLLEIENAPAPRLSRFLKGDTAPLSERATTGFIARYRRGRLRQNWEFLSAAEDYLDRIRRRS